MTRRTIGKSRWFADIPSYLKMRMKYNSSSENIISDMTTMEVPSTDSVWGLDPVAAEKFAISTSSSALDFDFKYSFLDPAHQSMSPSEQFNFYGVLNLLLTNIPQSDSSGLYGGVLGHNLKSLTDYNGAGITDMRFLLHSSDGLFRLEQLDTSEAIVNYSSNVPEYDGYSLWNINGWSASVSSLPTTGLGLKISSGYHFMEQDNAQKEVQIGGITLGRWFEPEHSFDLQATIIKENDGIKRTRTVGGNTITNVNYLGSESWGDLPAWTLQKAEGVNYMPVSQTGRRSWKVSLSYIQDDNMFSKHNNENQFFSYDPETESNTFDSSFGSFMGLTFDGQIPFLFCPDYNADDKEFAKCVITNKPTFKQVANNLFSTSLVLTEVF
tara:strand:- start:51 stop:1196 length:1146 start_codon:yes stop_codon:yes gene_type:complete